MRVGLLEKIRESSNNQVSLVQMQVRDYEIKDVMETMLRLKPNTSLIDLDNNELSDEGAHILGNYLPRFHNITELSIQFNHIGKAGALSLFRIKRDAPDITILFHGNEITDVGEMADIEDQAVMEEFKPIR